MWKLEGEWRWKLCEVFGEPPISRRGHTVSLFEEMNTLVVFGGIYGYSKLLNDVHIFNL